MISSIFTRLRKGIWLEDLTALIYRIDLLHKRYERTGYDNLSVIKHDLNNLRKNDIRYTIIVTSYMYPPSLF